MISPIVSIYIHTKVKCPEPESSHKAQQQGLVGAGQPLEQSVLDLVFPHGFQPQPQSFEGTEACWGSEDEMV